MLYHSDSYQELLEQSFQSEEPMAYDDLLCILEGIEETVMHSFNQNVIKEELHDHYEQQLLDFIGEKEALLIDINFRKTKGIMS